MRALLVVCSMLLASAAFAGDLTNTDTPKAALERCKTLDLTDAIHWCMSMDGWLFVCPRQTKAAVSNLQCWRFPYD